MQSAAFEKQTGRFLRTLAGVVAPALSAKATKGSQPKAMRARTPKRTRSKGSSGIDSRTQTGCSNLNWTPESVLIDYLNDRADQIRTDRHWQQKNVNNPFNYPRDTHPIRLSGKLRKRSPPLSLSLQELGNPFAVLHVGLAARHILDVLGVDQQDLREPTFTTGSGSCLY
jgi:hypothetical protein